MHKVFYGEETQLPIIIGGEVSKEILDGILNYLVASLTFC